MSLLRSLLVALFALTVPAHAEAIKIGLLKTTASGPIFVAAAKGYFAAEGLDAELVYFDGAQPIAVAVASGAIDFGHTGFTGGFYGLASQGVLRIIGGGASEVAGYHNQAFVVSNKAWAAGLRSLKDMPGHSLAVTQVGSPPQYALGQAAVKLGFDIKRVRILPLQSISATVAAITGGQADASGLTGSLTISVLARGDAKLLAYIGDVVPYQLAGTFTSSKTADDRGGLVRRFLAAVAKGSRAYHDAFIQGGKRADGPGAAELLAIIAKAVDQSPAEVSQGLPYVDAENRLDVADVMRQYAWYRAQGMIKGSAQADRMIDRRYVVDLRQ